MELQQYPRGPFTDPLLYFLDQLPYAAPGFASFAVGIGLAALSGFAAWRDKGDRRWMFLGGLIAFIGYGTLGLVLGARACVYDRQLLIGLHDYLYPFTALLVPGTGMLVYYWTERRYKILRVLLWIVWPITGFVVFEAWRGELFLNEWFDYSFGHYPRGGRAVRLWVATGLFGAYMCFYFIWQFARKNERPGGRIIAVGLILLGILVTSNGPSLMGFPVYPLAIFTCIPMVVVAYGMFRSDFLDLNDLLFRKNGLFFVVAAVLSLNFLAMAVIANYAFTAETLAAMNWKPYAIVPLASAVVVFTLGVIVAGSNPADRVNQYAALYMFSFGQYLVIMLVSSLKVHPLVFQRIDQSGYIFFAISTAAGLRTVFLILGERTTLFVRVVDVICFLTAALCLTPLLVRGFYIYEFGYFSASGPLRLAWIATSVVVLIVVMLKLRRAIAGENDTRRIRYVGLFFVGSALLMMSNIPATLGIASYPFGNLQFLPFVVFTVGLVRYGDLSFQGNAYRVSRRLSGLAFLLVAAFAGIFFMSGSGMALDASLFRMVVVVSPLFLFGHTLLFVLTRPITNRIDESYRLLEVEKDKVDLARQAVEVERRKADDLLVNILPPSIAQELKATGYVRPTHFESVSVLFTDFVGFTSYSAKAHPSDVVSLLDAIFEQFDIICERNGVSKLKTIGDSYMCAGGLPEPNSTHAIDVCLAALEMATILEGIRELRKQVDGSDLLAMRLGIHSGPVVAGVIGRSRFAYDVWGDAVNVASRIESSSSPHRINISESTHGLVGDFFVCEDRGEIDVKHRGSVRMYFLDRIKPHLSQDAAGIAPNERFRSMHRAIAERTPKDAELQIKMHPDYPARDGW